MYTAHTAKNEEYLMVRSGEVEAYGIEDQQSTITACVSMEILGKSQQKERHTSKKSCWVLVTRGRSTRPPTSKDHGRDRS